MLSWSNNLILDMYFFINSNIFRHSKLEIAFAIPASNDEKYNWSNSTGQGGDQFTGRLELNWSRILLSPMSTAETLEQSPLWSFTVVLISWFPESELGMTWYLKRRNSWSMYGFMPFLCTHVDAYQTKGGNFILVFL